MSTFCPQCGTTIAAGVRFCTNCGATVDGANVQGPFSAAGSAGQVPTVYQAQQPYQVQQQVQQPYPVQQQVPSWASGSGANQQSWGGQNAAPMDSLGFAGQNNAMKSDAVLKKALTAVVAVILGTLVLLIILGVLAALLPGLRCVLLIMIVGILLIPWIIYHKIRGYVRRTIGRSGLFF